MKERIWKKVIKGFAVFVFSMLSLSNISYAETYLTAVGPAFSWWESGVGPWIDHEDDLADYHAGVARWMYDERIRLIQTGFTTMMTAHGAYVSVYDILPGEPDYGFNMGNVGGSGGTTVSVGTGGNATHYVGRNVSIGAGIIRALGDDPEYWLGIPGVPMSPLASGASGIDVTLYDVPDDCVYRVTIGGRQVHAAPISGNTRIRLETRKAHESAPLEVTLYINNVLIETWSGLPRRAWLESIAVVSLHAPGWAIADPIPDSAPDLHVQVGDTIDWVEGITGTWGYTTTNLIPDQGLITDLTLDATGTDPRISTNGTTVSRIGVVEHEYMLQDNHALDMTTPLYIPDNSHALVSRYIYSTTSLAPSLVVRYAGTAIDKDGNSVAGQILAETGTNASGGEDGWTNQPLDISIQPDSIIGEFDTILTMPDGDTVVTNGVATRVAYNIDAPDSQGTPVSGVLTESGDMSNALSETVSGVVRIDTVPPIPAAIHNGGGSFNDNSNDALSGISSVNPSKIAFTAVGGAQPALNSFTAFDNIPLLLDGRYDVWVWATDRAGNEDIAMVMGNTYIGGEVVISKDTVLGATLHHRDCVNAGSVMHESDCLNSCVLGAEVQVEEGTTLVYRLILTNTDNAESATGTFTDDFPIGSDVSVMPTATSAPSGTGTISNVDIVLGASGSGHEGQYRVTGDYYLPVGETLTIEIVSTVKDFDEITLTNNVIRNQASLSWTVGTGMAQRTGTNESNYANHEVIERPGVLVQFTKVGADDTETGLAGAEFALYRWDGSVAPTVAQASHIVDSSELVDITHLPDGSWRRVKADGEDAVITDVFVSETSPLGMLDLGILPTGVYTLIETKAPMSYELPVGQWILTIDASKGDGGAGDYQIEIVGKSNSIMPPATIRDTNGTEPTYRLINTRPFSIGMSGLSGTKGILLIGFVIMVAAGNMYMVQSRKRKHFIFGTLENGCENMDAKIQKNRTLSKT